MATATATKTSPAKAGAPKKTRGRQANSKSGAIRAFLKKKPDAGPTAVTAALKRKGILISPAHVSNVKAAMLKKASSNGAASNGVKAKGPKRGKPGRKAAATDAVSISQLLEARKFAEQVGGVEQAVSLLQSLARLQ